MTFLTVGTLFPTVKRFNSSEMAFPLREKAERYMRAQDAAAAE